jgi:heme/copper-type cytochrome/quinol oxidase subunit 2
MKGQQSLGAIVVGIIIVILILCVFVYNLQDETDPTNTAIKEGAKYSIGVLFLFLIIIGLVVILALILRNSN